jgi:4-hydroxyphenylpyruvate dioxygenase
MKLYRSVLVHMGMMKEDINEIEKLAIMVDADEDGYLLQILTSTR